MACVKTLIKYPHAEITRSPNQLLIPVTIFNSTIDGAKKFNAIYLSLLKDRTLSKIKRTPSGGICTDRASFFPPCWDVRYSYACVEMTVILIEGMWRFQFRYDVKKEQTGMVGKQAFTLFTGKFKSLTGKSIDEYWRSDGLEIRKSVPKYRIEASPIVRETNVIEEAQTFYPCHHIDFHNSFPAGLANTHPEFRSTIEYFYERRNEHPEYKGCLNSLIGIFWSTHHKSAGYAQLAKDAISDNNARLSDITSRLEKSGRIPLLWNTDGVWYQGKPFHGRGEGSKLGEWENDHLNCKLRIKSRGAYEFIEKGVYTPVVRGVSKEVSSQWKWGDIFGSDATPITFYFDEEKGLCLNNQ